MPEELDKNKTEQDNGYIRNPEGKGGFGDRPEDINRNGRPKDTDTITYWMKKFLLATEKEHNKPRIQELAEKIVTMAYKDGNVKIMKEILDRIDGKTTIPIRHIGQIDTGSKEVAEALRAILENANTNTNTSSPNAS